jgi:hypothetical protein
MQQKGFAARIALAVATSTLVSAVAIAQVTPAAGVTPADDTPKFNVGATIFADYTYVDSPTAKDGDNNTIHSSAFQVSRAYINVTGNLNHWISFRITPDISRETSATASLSGSQLFRLKYAFAQFNLDDWTTKGSWIRAGVNQTPLIDYTEGIYRYRFQGTVFVEREGYLTSSDAGVSSRWVLPGNYGDIHGGFYNGEGYSKAEANNEKAFQLRGSFRPLPLGGIWKGLRVTGFLDEDHYVQSAKRTRFVGQVTFESPMFNGGVDAISAKDQTSITKTELSGKGWSVWLNPRMSNGWELLIRHDDTTPNKAFSGQHRKRDIDGIAYWFPNANGKSLALLLDRDSLKRSGLTPSVPNTTNYELKMLVNF